MDRIEMLKEKYGYYEYNREGDPYVPENLSKYVDHTLLKATATPRQIDGLCDEAIRYHFASVCVNPCHIGRVALKLAGSGVAPCVVIGFPLGENTSIVKAYEALEAISLGAKEVDMVMNLGAAKADDWDTVQQDIEMVVGSAKGKALVKVIIETCLLTDEEKVKACLAAKRAGRGFCQNLHGIFDRRRDGKGRDAYVRGRWGRIWASRHRAA